jgi:hypothetical protein
VEGFTRAVLALSAGRADQQFELKLVEAGAAFLRGAGDVPVGDSVADADNHAPTVMRTIRIIKRKT